MADAKITALTALTGANTNPLDELVIVDVSDTTMAASGTTKKTTRADLQVYVGGTVTADTPTLNLTQTWNNGAVTFNGIFQNITNTASAAASKLMDLQVGGTSMFNVRKDGYNIVGNRIALSTHSNPFNWAWLSSSSGSDWQFQAYAQDMLSISGQLLYAQLNKDMRFSWSSTTASTGVSDTGLSRISAGVIGVGTGAAGSTAGTLQALKYTGIGGTVTADAPVLDITQTWNSGAVSFTGIKQNITNTASAAASLLMDLQVGGVSTFSVRRDGRISTPVGLTSTSYNEIDCASGTGILLSVNAARQVSIESVGAKAGSGKIIGFSSAVDPVGGAPDVAFSRIAAGIVGVGTGASGSGAGALFFSERTAPSAPAANGVYIYAEDNGSGKTRLMALFNTGAAQQIAIEP